MDEKLDALIAEHAHELRTIETLDNFAVLHALADVESDHGARHLAIKHEASYCYGGFYYRAPSGEDLRRLSHIYGCLAHSSFSSWQLLFLAAYEEGFRGDPCELRNDAEAIHWVIRFLNRRIYDRYPRISPTGLADAWNSGSARDLNVPQGYIDKFLKAYDARSSGR
jgi:hypothetical protein